jgi:hypothetical protein
MVAKLFASSAPIVLALGDSGAFIDLDVDMAMGYFGQFSPFFRCM